MSKESQGLMTEREQRSRRTKSQLQPPESSTMSLSMALGLGLGTAGLLWLSHFPVAYGWFAWVALVPLLCLAHSMAKARHIYLATWIAGLSFFGLVLQWMRVADPMMYFTWAGLAACCSLFPLLAVYLLRRFERTTWLPLVITLPTIWTALEYLRAHVASGFPWYFLGHTQHDFLPVVQIADVGGAYAVTFLVAAVNALVFEWLGSRPSFQAFFKLGDRPPRRAVDSLVVQTLCVLILLAGNLAYGAWRLSQNEFASGPKVALIQGNLPQQLRNLASSPEGAREAASIVTRHYTELSDDAMEKRPQLIVWPETSFPYNWMEVSPLLAAAELPEDWRDAGTRRNNLAHSVARRWKTDVLLGLNGVTLGSDARERRYNTALLIKEDAQLGGRYDKIHRVPFGEYIPFRDWLPWMNAFSPYDFDYSITAGERLTRFPLDNYHFGVLICYEDTDPYLARQYVRTEEGEPAVDFLVNISNDGWFDGTSEHEEHLAICRFRAIESRRAVARAVNMGISAVIDGNGRVVALPGPDWAKSKKIEGVVTAAIPIDERISLYARWGDWLPWSCWGVVAAGLIWSVVLPRRASRSMVD